MVSRMQKRKSSPNAARQVGGDGSQKGIGNLNNLQGSQGTPDPVVRCEKQSTFGALESEDFWQLLDNFLICNKVHVTKRMFLQLRCLATFPSLRVCKFKRFCWVPGE